MAAEDLTERVIGIIAKTAHKPIESITPESTFEQIGIDSLDGIQVLFALEQEFDISIPDEEAKEIRGIADAVRGVRELLAAREAGSA
jgi:acyl carrier protein